MKNIDEFLKENLEDYKTYAKFDYLNIPLKIDELKELIIKATNNKEFIEAIKKSRKGEKINFDERKRNQFDISFGNLQTLRLLPDMMNDDEFRDKLRHLTLDFMTAKGIR